MMANQNEKHPLNVKGYFYNDLSCVDCGMCPEVAPMLFRRDDDGGYSYVYRQPETSEEAKLAREAMVSCPAESIGEDR
ncbi:MAG: ferredoxin [Akkermansiaceae bacterium]|jgi:ferredoxin